MLYESWLTVQTELPESCLSSLLQEAAEAEKDAGEHGEPAESESPAPAEPTVPLSPKSAQDRWHLRGI